MGRLGFMDGVSTSYSYFRRVRNFDIVYTAAVWLSPAKKFMSRCRYGEVGSPVLIYS